MLPATVPKFKGAVGDGGAIESLREVDSGNVDCPLPMSCGLSYHKHPHISLYDAIGIT